MKTYVVAQPGGPTPTLGFALSGRRSQASQALRHHRARAQAMSSMRNRRGRGGGSSGTGVAAARVASASAGATPTTGKHRGVPKKDDDAADPAATAAAAAARLARMKKKYGKQADVKLIAGLIATLVAAVLFAGGFAAWLWWWRGHFDSALSSVGLTGLTSNAEARRAAEGQVNKDGSKAGYSGRVLTAAELAEGSAEAFDLRGESGPLYVSILGEVYDVSTGTQFYGKGKGYDFFTGVDGSAAFITGDFTEEGLKKPVWELEAAEALEVDTWARFYRDHETYSFVGRVAGDLYDSQGRPTAHMEQVKRLLKEGKRLKKEQADLDQEFPGCNSRWAQGKGGEVWCSTNSAGITRDWAGLPRKMKRVGGSLKCVCVHPDKLGDARLKEYDGCAPTSDTCVTS